MNVPPSRNAVHSSLEGYTVPKHNVTFNIPERELGKADVEFTVNHDEVRLGKLKVSKGSVVWVPKDYVYGFKMSWKQFAELMQEKGVKEGR